MVLKYPNGDTPSIEALEALLANALGTQYEVRRMKLPIGPDFVLVKASNAVGISVLRYPKRVVSNQFIPSTGLRGLYGMFSVVGMMVYSLLHGSSVKPVREAVDNVLRQQLPKPS